MIKINQIKLNISTVEEALAGKICKLLHIDRSCLVSYRILRKSMDARKKDKLMYIYSVAVTTKGIDENKAVLKLKDNNISIYNEDKYVEINASGNFKRKVAIVGLGPAGLFCGLTLARAGVKPVIYERGSSIHERTAIVNAFWETGELDTATNVQFGEGGAGTFSDGKLNSVIKERGGRIKKVLETFVEFGASPEILYVNKPHIGTDVLSLVVQKIRDEIISLGGVVNFNSQVTDLYIEKGCVKGVRINSEKDEEYDTVILAPGHSARDTFMMLREKDIPMESKAFAVGLRIEHSQGLINKYAYGTEDNSINNVRLPVADYKVTAKAFPDSKKERGVYSFCMCPGGYVVNASSEKDMTCVNGMSYSGRDGTNANSAIVVTVSPEDFGGTDILSGMEFQRRLEAKAYRAGNGAVPYQLNCDFIKGNKTESYGSITPMIKGKYSGANLREVLPEYISESIIDGMKTFDKIICGFNGGEAVFSGVESRTSSPVRILRNEYMESTGIKGLFPCGEGAGYAGGITSAAVDGIKVAEAVLTQ